MDKYTIFNDLTIADFYHILRSLEQAQTIKIVNKNLLDAKLLELLKDYDDGENK